MCDDGSQESELINDKFPPIRKKKVFNFLSRCTECNLVVVLAASRGVIGLHALARGPHGESNSRTYSLNGEPGEGGGEIGGRGGAKWQGGSDRQGGGYAVWGPLTFALRRKSSLSRKPLRGSPDLFLVPIFSKVMRAAQSSRGSSIAAPRRLPPIPARTFRPPFFSYLTRTNAIARCLRGGRGKSAGYAKPSGKAGAPQRDSILTACVCVCARVFFLFLTALALAPFVYTGRARAAKRLRGVNALLEP